MEAPVVNVGIMTEKAVSFVFHGEYVHTETGKFLTGEQRALFVNGNIVYNGRLFKEIFFEPASPSSSFELKAVTIGRNFHWQRQEDQCFKGAFNLVTGENGIVVINQVDVEEYLTSVISSEMSAQASKELLKAHAVISRSWLLAQIEKNFRLGRKEEKQQNCYRDNEQLIRWYDREDHNIFDVCADDHCQRYQGITRASNPIVQEVIHETKGEILVNGETICDARFSKCCGGVTEQFEHCWEPIPHSYLLVVHLMISILFAIIILAFKAINNRSVIDAIYMIASYTYGPLLGLFVFGLFTKKHPRDKFVPYICIVSPLLCFLTDYLVKQHTGYAFGYEMLMLNGAITFGGLWLSSIGNGQLTIRKKSINT